MQGLGRMIFRVGIISYLLLLPIILKKVSLGTIQGPALPTIAIFAAPVALCLAEYMNSFQTKNMVIVWTFLVNTGQPIPLLIYMVLLEEIIAIFIVLYVLVKYIQFLKLPVHDETKDPVESMS